MKHHLTTRLSALGAAVLIALTMSGCGGGNDDNSEAVAAATQALTQLNAQVAADLAAAQADQATPDPADSDDTGTAVAGPTTDADETGGDLDAADPNAIPVVPGYAPGEAPAIPLFTLPDLSLLDAQNDAFVVDFTEAVGDYPGLTVAPASCDASSQRITSDGATLLYGDGAAVDAGQGGTLLDFGDGSGISADDVSSFINLGNGAGMYTNGAISIINNGDGSGTYQGPDVLIQIGGDGSGTYTDRTTSNDNHGDGSATYASGNVSIINRGDGTGVYSDGTITIENLGDGTALVNGLEVEAEPLAPVPALGVFPVLDAIDTADLCGVTVTLDAAVLFDYDKATIRPEAEPVLENLATALNDLGVASAVVEGHTDAHGSDAYNQTLSEQRAEAVVQTLEADGATAGLTAVGYGESRPVAPNTMPDGADNPAGRQLNRRVEVFVPAL